jgi:hypothetical protein
MYERFIVDCGRFRSVSLFGELSSATSLKYVGCYHWPVLLLQLVGILFRIQDFETWWMAMMTVLPGHVCLRSRFCGPLLMPMSARGL